jgi:hypothetical protein
MIFSQELLGKFRSLEEFALYQSAALYGPKVVEYKGADLVHLFSYKKTDDITYFRVVNKVLSTRAIYMRVPIAEFNANFIIHLKTPVSFDKDKEFMIAVFCADSNKLTYNRVSADDIREVIRPGIKLAQMAGHLGCANCHDVKCKLQKCSQCGVVKYCSKECQTKHWKAVHKAQCTKVL